MRIGKVIGRVTTSCRTRRWSGARFLLVESAGSIFAGG